MLQEKKDKMYEELRGMVETASRRATNDVIDHQRGPLRRLDLRESALLSRYSISLKALNSCLAARYDRM